jgi:hypothetical protein
MQRTKTAKKPLVDPEPPIDPAVSAAIDKLVADIMRVVGLDKKMFSILFKRTLNEQMWAEGYSCPQAVVRAATFRQVARKRDASTAPASVAA